VEVLERAVAPLVNAKQYEILLALERQGVQLVHSLAVAAQGGRHEQADCLLKLGAIPNARVLVLAILTGRQMTARFMPLVKWSPEHADAAANAQVPDLLCQFIDSGVRPTYQSYKWAGRGGRKGDATLAVLLHKGEPWRIGTQALLIVMHRLGAQQLERLLATAPSRFNREKLLARAIRCGSEAVIQEIVHYGFGARVNARVALRAVGETLKYPWQQQQSRSLNATVGVLVRIHAETRSELLPDRAVSRLLRRAVCGYISSFCDVERGRAEQYAQFMTAFNSLLSLADADHVFMILTQARADFRVDCRESPQARNVHRQALAWPLASQGFQHFKIQFERHLDDEIYEAAPAVISDSTGPTGP